MNPFIESQQYFPTPIQATVFYEKYSRYREDLGRREAWVETVDRATDFLRELSRNRLLPADYERIRQGILRQQVMPSMRLLAMAGPAARRNNIALFNCSYLTLDSLQAFVEIMLASMHGTGVGYSVESRYTLELPPVFESTGRGRYHLIGDSTEGWCDALADGLDAWFKGEEIEFNYSLIRPAGAILKTKGGRASGPEPLQESLGKIRDIIRARAGRNLRPIDAHDIACWIASASICGGVRRSALICLFDARDEEMMNCKQGAFWEHNPQRSYANNSAVISSTTSDKQLSDLLTKMDENGTGEPGLFNRVGVINARPARRKRADFGVNPCGEIALRPMQVCNLSSAVCRQEDDYEALANKVELATIIGTIQAMADHFPGFRAKWHENQVEERLLGVDLNGQMDSPLVQYAGVQMRLKEVAILTNAVYAQRLGINQAASVTTVKPSGNSSQLLDASSGLHARHSPYYIRNIRLNAHSPVRRFLADQGVPMNPENGQQAETATTWVVPFPVAAPAKAQFRRDRDALTQLNYWLQVRRFWTEHQPSVTISYRPEEMPAIIEWCQEHKDFIAGLSFLRLDDHAYPQAPYQEVSEAEFVLADLDFPLIENWERLPDYDTDHYTDASQELACSAGVCETV